LPHSANENSSEKFTKKNAPPSSIGRNMLAMNNVRSFAFLFPAIFLLGCTLPTGPTGASSPVTGNWQIQSGTALTSPPTVPYLVGALQGTNSALTGTFTTAQPGTLSPVVDSYSGTYDVAMGVLSLQSPLPPELAGTIVTLSVPTNPTSLATGTLAFTCPICAGLTVTFPAVGAEIAPLNGTYTGTLSGTVTTLPPATSTPISGTASVTFTQSTTPNANGQFPLTAAVTFPSSSGVGTVTLPGLVSGITLELSTEPCVIPFAGAVCNVVGPGSVLFAYTNPTASQITVTSLNNAGATSAVNLTGTLTLQ
jgi:hypothetical protein